MGLLTIGAFARASRLTPKALRLYDELGLLPPAHVDPDSGYRFYDPAQLERARLVAWLRRLGMPLARIRLVSSLAPAAAAAEVASYWAQEETATATRRELAAFLIRHLSGEDAAMPVTDQPLTIRYATESDIGRVRPANWDAAYAGPRLLAVADGFGAGEGGDAASAAAIGALRPLDAEIPAADLLNLLDGAVRQAQAAVQEVVEGHPARAGAGSTLTALLLSGSRLALIHIGDSRAYLLRDGALFQITHDHSYVASLVDEGKLSPDEAGTHPERALLLRALDGSPGMVPDISFHEARAGDRYLLCSDGLSAVVPASVVHETLRALADPEQAAGRLVEEANERGGPDNVTCVVADVTVGVS